MKKRLFKFLIIFSHIIFLGVLLVACGGGGTTVSITYKLDGGKLPSGAPESYNTASAPDFSKIIPTRNNYDFEGWYTDEACTAQFVASDVKTSSVTVYAKWEADTFDIDYELDGGECDGLPDKYTYGTRTSLAEYVPVKTGYIFGGWYLDEEFVESAIIIDDDWSEDLTVYAKWLEEPEKLADIDDIEKAYFGGSSVSLELTDYIESNGLELIYSCTSSNGAVASAEISGNTLTVNILAASGSADMTLTVSVGENVCLTYEFTVTVVQYTKIACVGDSLTEASTYTEQLAGLLSAYGVTVENYGASGSSITPYTEERGYGAYTVYAADKYQASLAADADVVVLLFGTNDARYLSRTGVLEEYKQGYRSLVAAYRAINPDVKIVMVTSPPVLEGNVLSLSNSDFVNYLYPTQLSLAEELGATLVDFRAEVESMGSGYAAMFKDDGVHLSDDGSLTLAALIRKAL